MEEVDIVDENDRVIGKTTKEDAHSKGLLHRTVISEVKDSKGRWLLIKQAADKQDAGQYVSPMGGHVTAGESEDEGLKREAFEELGLKDFEFSLVGKLIFNRFTRGRQENHFFILYEIRSDETPVLNHESVSYRYFTEEELRKELKENPESFGNAFLALLQKFYPHLLT
jgi:isopentenyl-diphosphate Delta-isomerase